MSKEYPTVNETIAYDEGFADAEDYWCAKEQERIIRLLEEHDRSYLEVEASEIISVIKDPTRNITSEILPDGTIYIEEIKGEN